MSNSITDLKIVGLVLKNLAEFMDKKPILRELPDESDVVDLSAYDLGTVSVKYSKGVLTIQKLT